eukprot:9098891-Karenia_brevis.AAC.1
MLNGRFEKFLPGCESLQAAVKVYKSLPHFAVLERQKGVIALEIQVTVPDATSSAIAAPPCSKVPRPSGVATGLPNLGSTCWANAILQSIFSCTSLQRILEVPVVSEKAPDQCMGHALHNLYSAWKE